MESQIVGNLACQRDSYLQTLQTEVIACTKLEPPNPQPATTEGSKHRPGETWQVECADSVLFPEGGGQPSDHGTLHRTCDADADAQIVQVNRVVREGLRCLLHLPQPLAVSDKVCQNLDFPRRWDHMQQHTGQHLLSAILNAKGFQTVGWGMGREGGLNYVDLASKPDVQVLQAVQAECVAAIGENLPIAVETSDESASSARLPGDYDQSRGTVRVIKIGDLDRNTCCGTHLQQTSHISLILLHSLQPVSKQRSRLFFAAGERAVRLSTTSLESVNAICKTVGCGKAPEEAVARVEELQAEAVKARKRETGLLLEIARFQSREISRHLEAGGVVCLHRAEGDMGYVKEVFGGVKDVLDRGCSAVVVVLGEEGGKGTVVVAGAAARVETAVASIVAVVPNVKGSMVRDRWQGKVDRWQKADLQALIQTFQA
ncbi:hypothetical protein MBLNU230_g2390t1 [Neophaeotheca triangularis]